MMDEIQHERLTLPCTHCGDERIHSSFITATSYKEFFSGNAIYDVNTCRTCDAPSGDEPFAEEDDGA